jgi:hypothetical protein
VVQIDRDQDKIGTSIILDQPLEISSPKLIISKRRDIIGGIQSRFMYQFEPMED